MTTPASGAISMDSFSAITKNATGVTNSLNDTDVRKLLNKTNHSTDSSIAL